MKVTAQAVPEVLLIEPRVFGDDRGFFFESFHAARYIESGIKGPFVQDSQSFSRKGVLRGLHFQWPRHAQGKLVSVVSGAVWDVAVDVRRGSPTYGHWVGAELTDSNHHQLWVPLGFAHGFVVLSETVLLQYKFTAPYSPADQVSIRWNDPTLAIQWPVQAPVLSDKDAVAPWLAELPQDRLPKYTQ